MGSAHSLGRTKLDNRAATRKQLVLCEEKKKAEALQSYPSRSHCAVALAARSEVMPKENLQL